MLFPLLSTNFDSSHLALFMSSAVYATHLTKDIKHKKDIYDENLQSKIEKSKNNCLDKKFNTGVIKFHVLAKSFVKFAKSQKSISRLIRK